MNVSDIEPVERNLKAIRTTVVALFLLMVVGGCLIWYKYTQQQEKDRQEVIDGRSPRISRLTKNFAGVCQDGVARGLDALEGKVWVVAPIVTHFPEENKIQLAKMQELAERYKDRDDFHLVCISVTDPYEHGYEELAEIAEEVGASIDRWWFMAAKEESAIGFLKNHLKMAHINERKGVEAEKYGKYDVPAHLRVVDQSRRVRGEHQQFDFDFAALKTEEAQRELAENPALAEEPETKEAAQFYLNMDAEWTKRMHKVIDYTFDEAEEDKDPDYITAIIVALAIIAFIVVMGVRLRKSKSGE